MKVLFRDDLILREITESGSSHRRFITKHGIELVDYGNPKNPSDTNHVISLRELYAKIKPEHLKETPMVGDVWIAYFPWEDDADKAQEHPCILIKAEDDTLVFLAIKITSPDTRKVRTADGRILSDTDTLTLDSDIIAALVPDFHTFGIKLHDETVLRVSKAVRLSWKNLIERSGFVSEKAVRFISAVVKKLHAGVNFEKEWKKAKSVK